MFAGSVEHYSFGPLVEFWLLPSSFLMKEGHVMLLVIGTIFFFLINLALITWWNFS